MMNVFDDDIVHKIIYSKNHEKVNIIFCHLWHSFIRSQSNKNIRSLQNLYEEVWSNKPASTRALNCSQYERANQRGIL